MQTDAAAGIQKVPTTNPVVGKDSGEIATVESPSSSSTDDDSKSNSARAQADTEETSPSVTEGPPSEAESSLSKLQSFLDREKSSAGGASQELGITWIDLTVKGISTDAAVHENFVSQFDVPRKLRSLRRQPATRTILDSSHGCVKPGEMLLVLGKPGSVSCGGTASHSCPVSAYAGTPPIDITLHRLQILRVC
jgi:hypothetical protein